MWILAGSVTSLIFATGHYCWGIFTLWSRISTGKMFLRPKHLHHSSDIYTPCTQGCAVFPTSEPMWFVELVFHRPVAIVVVDSTTPKWWKWWYLVVKLFTLVVKIVVHSKHSADVDCCADVLAVVGLRAGTMCHLASTTVMTVLITSIEGNCSVCFHAVVAWSRPTWDLALWVCGPLRALRPK